MDKTTIIVFVFSTILLVASVAVLLVLGRPRASRGNPVQRGGAKKPRSNYVGRQRNLGGRVYPPPSRSNRRA